ncbi:hypothetical protein QFZ39_004784 [Paraburkholderia graminis]|uniref:Uncharacterized protein n=1 Tax=Paraburkholderia graminis TaxID=60548 RepID=A0ABD5CGL1_9BURK|nr:hypothetical protein [Paraburkholderia graminis]MDR6204031.1 hypothetical protein [Paraburkholderia graminis]
MHALHPTPLSTPAYQSPLPRSLQARIGAFRSFLHRAYSTSADRRGGIHVADSGARGTDTRGCLTSAKVMKNLDVSDSLVIRLLTTVLSNDCHCAGFACISSMRSSDLRCWRQPHPRLYFSAIPSSGVANAMYRCSCRRQSERLRVRKQHPQRSPGERTSVAQKWLTIDNSVGLEEFKRTHGTRALGEIYKFMQLLPKGTIFCPNRRGKIGLESARAFV